MRHITLKKRGFLGPDLDTLKQIVKIPLGGQKQGSTNIEDMRLDLRIEDALNAVKDNRLVLEDADWKRLCAKLKAYPWGVSDREIVEMTDDVLDAPPASSDLDKAKSAASRLNIKTGKVRGSNNRVGHDFGAR